MFHAGPSTGPSSSSSRSSSERKVPPDQRRYRQRPARPWWTGAKQTPPAPLEDTKSSARPRSPPPYKLRTVLKQVDGDRARHCQCVEFFPFTGAKRPLKTRHLESWDIWEDAAAYCVGDKVVIGRCQDDTDGACWDPIWQVRIQRQVQALAVCPTRPHILASGSRDQTIRIWNLFGHDTELSPGELPNQNYPMGDADEGNHIVAILCGNWPGGHRDDVTTVAWHPSHRAIASSSRDHSFKIWALPVLPPPRVPKPDRDYRPILVSSPIFSTNRISPQPIDSIHWLNGDIIVVRTRYSTVTFQWLSYRRYFERGTWEPLGDTIMSVPDAAHWHDINDSRSFVIFSTFYTDGRYTYHRTGFHSAFAPTPEEQEAIAANPNLVQTFLIAIPKMTKFPEIVLFAPTLAPANDPPKIDPALRKDLSDFCSDTEEEGDDDPVAGEATPGRKLGNGTPSGSGGAKGGPSQTPSSKSRRGGPATPISPEWEDIAEFNSEDEAYVDPELRSDSETSNSGRDTGDDDPMEGAPRRRVKKRVRRTHAWLLRANAWGKIVDKHRKSSYATPALKSDNSVIMCCAISPRGARWVVGVGQAESVFIWRLVDA